MRVFGTKRLEPPPTANGRRNFGISSSARDPNSYEVPLDCAPRTGISKPASMVSLNSSAPRSRFLFRKLESNTGPTRSFDLETP